MGSTRMSRVLNKSGQKSTRIEIYKKNLTNPTRTRGEPSWLADSNPF